MTLPVPTMLSLTMTGVPVRNCSSTGTFSTRWRAAEAITATAHKLARIIYRLIKHGEAYVRQGMEAYEKQFQDRKLRALQKAAKTMWVELTPTQTLPSGVSQALKAKMGGNIMTRNALDGGA